MILYNMHNNTMSRYRQRQKIAYSGFTLIELMIAIMVFAVITMISYRVISSLIKTKEVITAVHNKWGGLSNAIIRLNKSINQVIPLTVLGADGNILSAIQGKFKLENKFDAQLELTESGFIGDQIYGSSPPRRIGYRFADKRLYLVTWPVLNRVINTIPRMDILLENVQSFDVKFLYLDGKWREIWPTNPIDSDKFPTGVRVNIKLMSKEEITRQWAL